MLTKSLKFVKVLVNAWQEQSTAQKVVWLLALVLFLIAAPLICWYALVSKGCPAGLSSDVLGSGLGGLTVGLCVASIGGYLGHVCVAKSADFKRYLQTPVTERSVLLDWDEAKELARIFAIIFGILFGALLIIGGIGYAIGYVVWLIAC